MYPHGLIGKRIRVMDSTLEGKVVDETKETLKIETNGETKTLLKKAITFKLESGEIIVGKDIVKRPEERVKGR